MIIKIIFAISILSLLISCNSDKKSSCTEGNCINGYGVKTYPDGGIEKGEWQKGELNGSGEQFFGENSEFAGDTYIGGFKNGVYHGQGVYTDVSEGLTLEGFWENGNFVNENLAQKTKNIHNDLEWELFKNTKYSFQVKFPKVEGIELEIVEKTFEDTDYGDVSNTSFNLNCQKSNHINLAYSIVVLDIGKEYFEGFDSVEYKNYFKKTELTLEELSNCKSIMKKIYDGKDYFGREIWFKNEEYGIRVKSRIIVRNGFEYRITVMMPDNKYLNPNVNLFMNSFEFI